jgi:hypothetical protein
MKGSIDITNMNILLRINGQRRILIITDSATDSPTRPHHQPKDSFSMPPFAEKPTAASCFLRISYEFAST